MSVLLEALEASLSAEAEAWGRLLEMMSLETAASASMDDDALEAAAGEIPGRLEAAERAAALRRRCAAEAARALGAEPSPERIGERAGEPWRGRLSRAAGELRIRLGEAAAVNRLQKRLGAQALDYLDRCARAFGTAGDGGRRALLDEIA